MNVRDVAKVITTIVGCNTTRATNNAATRPDKAVKTTINNGAWRVSMMKICTTARTIKGQPSDRDQRQWRGRRPSRRGGYSAQGRYGNRSPYANVTCYTCGKTGHISPQCWQNTSYPPPGPSYRR